MGLDMYLERVKKIDGMTLEEIMQTAEYIDYLGRPEKYADSTFDSWCGGDERKVRKDKLDEVKRNIKKQYSAWDENHEYGYDGVAEGVGYWRKANQIHNWFVEECADGVDECQQIQISKDQLKELLKTTEKVKKASKLIKGKVNNGYHFINGKEEPIIEDGMIIEDPTVAKELLPVRKGFFFGGTEYDEWYLNDINYTVKTLKKVLKETDFDNEYIVYQASW